MRNKNNNIDWLFETSWEVCNKIGGIYTVLSTKAKALQDLYKDRVVFVGPDIWDDNNKSPYFKEYKTLLRSASSKLKLPYGISIRTGRWNVPGNPLVVLVKFDGVNKELPAIYGKMWELYGVDSLHAYGDYDEGCAFAVTAAIVVEALTIHLKADREHTVAHFDEWTTAMGLLWLKHSAPQIATVFTTHATSIGRSICGNGKPLYDYFTGYHGDQMARELNMESKHSLEKTAAHMADCFTTVSDVTAKECAQLLDITPQVVTPNGFEPNFIPSAAKYAEKRKAARTRLLALASALTGKSYAANTFLIATSGRNEYRNKGIDMYIDAMKRVGDEIRNADSQIVALILVPAWSAAPLTGLKERMEGRLAQEPELNFITHHLHNEDSDSIFRRLSELKVNNIDDKLIFIYLPCYLDGRDGILDIPYYDMMPALDLTIFPSYYEPWGYTPLESIAFGVPTVSSDKAGFGQWILKSSDATFTGCGAEVIERTDSNYSYGVEEIYRKVCFLFNSDEDVRKQCGVAARHTASQADWHIFISNYVQAFDVAIMRRDQRMEGC